MKRRICILGTYHGYQYSVPRLDYLKTVEQLIRLYSVDLVSEEATGVSSSTYAENIAKEVFKSNVSWKNVDLTNDERRTVSKWDGSGGTLFDFDFHSLREWVWLVRTSKNMNESALLICGCVHTFSVAEKFRWAGFDVETHVFIDKEDDARIRKH